MFSYKIIRVAMLTGIFLLLNCTGLNLRTWPVPVSPNTHPIESYAGIEVFLKGGYIYHNGSNVLYTGTAKLERSGKACSQSFLYLIAIGSSRIYDAKVEGAVNSIGVIEEEVLAILGGLYHRHCTIVIGEGR